MLEAQSVHSDQEQLMKYGPRGQPEGRSVCASPSSATSCGCCVQMCRLTPHMGRLAVGTLRTEGQPTLYTPSHAECLLLIGTDVPLSLAIALHLTPGKSYLFSEAG